MAWRMKATALHPTLPEGTVFEVEQAIDAKVQEFNRQAVFVDKDEPLTKRNYKRRDLKAEP